MYESFNSFYRQCNQIIGNKIAWAYDLPDARWRDYFDEGMSPHEAIECAYEDFWSDHFPRHHLTSSSGRISLPFFRADLKETCVRRFSFPASPQAGPGRTIRRRGRRPQA